MTSPTPGVRRPRRAFTMTELVVVILVLGILAGIAAPRLVEASADAEASTILTNVKQILDAAQRFEAENGRLPRNTNRGLVPRELCPDYLPDWLFTTPTSTGFPLDWDGPGTGSDRYGVTLKAASSRAHATDLYARFERLADDGHRDAGYIRTSSDLIIFYLAPK